MDLRHRPRCVGVAAGLTAAVWGAAAVLARAWADTPATAPGAAVVRLCLALLGVALAWAWTQGLAGVADAWRGAPPLGRTGVRRLVVLACGIALTGALTPPALADGPTAGHPAVATGDGHGPGRGATPLAGLPLPDRAVGPGHARPRSVVVRRGDTLWSLAERRLPAAATAPQVAAAWQALYHRNRAVIGTDPDLIRPGQVLTLGRHTHSRKEHP